MATWDAFCREATVSLENNLKKEERLVKLYSSALELDYLSPQQREIVKLDLEKRRLAVKIYKDSIRRFK
jgi:hypothetical protein